MPERERNKSRTDETSEPAAGLQRFSILRGRERKKGAMYLAESTAINPRGLVECECCSFRKEAKVRMLYSTREIVIDF